MSKLHHLLPFFLIVFTQPVSAQIHEEEVIYEVVEEGPEPVIREEYNEDGTYKQYTDERLSASGFHKKQKLEGVYTAYNSNGSEQAIKHYKNGLLHGLSTEYGYGGRTTKSYDKGVQVGYEEFILIGDILSVRKGPYFTGSVTNHTFTSYTRTHYTNDTICYFQYDTIFFRANQPPEIHRWIEHRNEDNAKVFLTLHSECKPHEYKAESFTSEDLNKLLRDYRLRDYDFDFRDFDHPKDVVVYDEKGYPCITATPEYWVTRRENHSVFDSLLNVKTNDTYNHFRFDDQGKLIFKAKKDIFERGYDFRWTYDYMKNGNVFYSISSMNYKPEKVWSTNDSINKVIQKGGFTDYYGTLYITQPTGTIDTSYSKEIIPYRYKNDIAPGKYYFLPAMGGVRIEWLEVNAKGITFFKANVEIPTKIDKTYKMNIVFQHDSTYHLFSGLRAYPYRHQILKTKQGLVSIDYFNSDYEDYYSLEQLVEMALADSILDFKSIILTEKQYLEALKRKKISEMPKEDFIACMKALEPIRMKERAVRDRMELTQREAVRKQTRQLFQVIYNQGYNPYFTENEFAELMESYAWTEEEKRMYKKIVRP